MLEFEPGKRRMARSDTDHGGQAWDIRLLRPGQHYHAEWHMLRMQSGRPTEPADPRRRRLAGDPARVTIGCFEGWHMRAAAILQEFASGSRRTAIVTLSVERAWQGRGCGTALMAQALDVALDRGIERLYLTCHALNRPAQQIAEKYGARIGFEGCECFAEFVVREETEAEA